MKNNFDLEVKKILKEAENEMFELHHPYVGSEHMLLGSSRKKSELALYTPLLKRIIADAIEEAEESGENVVRPEHLLIGMLEEGEGVGIRILINMDINLEGIYSEIIKNTTYGIYFLN